MATKESTAELTFAPHPKDPRFINLTGAQFGYWTVLGFYGRRSWWCICRCTTIKIVSSTSLKCGDSQSCGCWRREESRQRLSTHNLSGSPEYVAYSHARNRCETPSAQDAQNYKDRGIAFLFDSFEQFWETLGPKPTVRHTLERINNDGPYSADNCRWATRKEQSNNRRSNVYLTAFGVTKQLKDWASDLSMTHSAIIYRIKSGWCEECAVTIPVVSGQKGGCTHR